MKPLRGKVRKKTAMISILMVSLVSSVICLPTIVFTKLKLTPRGDICYIHWPDGNPTESIIDQIYNIALMVTTYFIPVIIMGKI